MFTLPLLLTLLKLLSYSAYGAEQVPLCLETEVKSPLQSSAEEKLKIQMKDLSDHEVFTRLVMSETMASQCPSLELARGIAWVIKNRMKAQRKNEFGLGREVFFKEKQFRSSTGSCDVSEKKTFLCPFSSYENDEKNKVQIWEWAKQAVKETEETSNPFPQVYQYYFFKHFDSSKNCAKWKGKLPSWANDKRRLVLPPEIKIDRACVGFYK